MPRKNRFESLIQSGQMRVARKPQRGKRVPLRGLGRRPREAAYVQYNALVEGVLEELREKGYFEHLPLDRWPGEPRWCIGEWDKAAVRKQPLVEVTLDLA